MTEHRRQPLNRSTFFIDGHDGWGPDPSQEGYVLGDVGVGILDENDPTDPTSRDLTGGLGHISLSRCCQDKLTRRDR